MPKPKRDVNALIANSQPARPSINRGPGYQLSTTNPDAELETKAPSPPEPKLKSPTVYRESAKVDKELIKTFKMIAAQEDRNLYEVMEEALRYWLQFHNSTKGKVE